MNEIKYWSLRPEFRSYWYYADYCDWGLSVRFTWFESFRGIQIQLGPYHFSPGWHAYWKYDE
jgi:hypothetical protein